MHFDLHFEIICLIQLIFNIPGIIDITPEQLECCITKKLSIRLQLELYKNKRLFMYMYIQWNLWNPTPEFSNIVGHPTKISNPKVFLLTKIKT